MIEIELSAEEKQKGALGPGSLARVVGAIEDDGVVVIRQAVAHAPLDRLQARMTEDTARLQAFHDQHGGNPRTPGHLQQGPPPTRAFVFPEVSANPFAIQVAKAMLGEEAYLEFYNGNTNCPGSAYQAVHLDNRHLWPHSPIASPTYSLVINIPTADCTVDNGAVELWPGTHMISIEYEDGNVPQAALDERRRARPPVPGLTDKGDLLIRDARLWHRGVPNRSDKPRHMIAFVYIAGWHKRRRTIRFEKGCEAVFDAVDFDFNAEYVDGDGDYLFAPSKMMYKRQGTWRADRDASQRVRENVS